MTNLFLSLFYYEYLLTWNPTHAQLELDGLIKPLASRP